MWFLIVGFVFEGQTIKSRILNDGEVYEFSTAVYSLIGS